MQLTPTYSTEPKTRPYTDYFKVKLIIDVLCRYSKLSREILLCDSQARELVVLRQIGMALSKQNTKLTHKQVAKKFKKINHTTSMHSFQTISDLCETDKKILNMVREIQDMVEKHFILTFKF